MWQERFSAATDLFVQELNSEAMDHIYLGNEEHSLPKVPLIKNFLTVSRAQKERTTHPTKTQESFI